MRSLLAFFSCALLLGSILPPSLIAASSAHEVGSLGTSLGASDHIITQATTSPILGTGENHQSGLILNADAEPTAENGASSFVVIELPNPPGVDMALCHLVKFHTALEEIENSIETGERNIQAALEQAKISLWAFENAVPGMLSSLENEFSSGYVQEFNAWLENFRAAANELLNYLRGAAVEASEALRSIANVEQLLSALPTGGRSVYFVADGQWFEDKYGNKLPLESEDIKNVFVAYPRDEVAWVCQIFNDELRWPFWDPPKAKIDFRAWMNKWLPPDREGAYMYWDTESWEWDGWLGARTLLTLKTSIFPAPFEPGTWGTRLEFDWQSTTGGSGSDFSGMVLEIKNRNPAASLQPVEPQEPKPWGTTFRFWTEYTDPDGHPPAYVRVYIDGSPFDMMFVSGDYKTGAVYEYWWQTGSDDLGTHSYYFETWDGYGDVYRSRVSSGPTVIGKDWVALTIYVKNSTNYQPVPNAKVTLSEGTVATEYTWSDGKVVFYAPLGEYAVEVYHPNFYYYGEFLTLEDNITKTFYVSPKPPE